MIIFERTNFKKLLPKPDLLAEIKTQGRLKSFLCFFRYLVNKILLINTKSTRH